MSLGNTKDIKSWISEDSELGGSTVNENETSCLISKVYKIFTLNRKEVYKMINIRKWSTWLIQKMITTYIYCGNNF